MSAIWYDHAVFRCPTCSERVRLDRVQPFHARLRPGQRFGCPGCGGALTWAAGPIRTFQLGQALLLMALGVVFVPGSSYASILVLALASVLLAAGMLMQRPVPLPEGDVLRDAQTPRPEARPSPQHPELQECDIERILRRDYPEADLPEIRRQVAEVRVRERIRVVVACLKNAEGSTQRLRRELRRATSDWREAIAAAEYPTVSRRWIALRKRPESELQAAYDRDWQQYSEWLERSASERDGLRWERGSAWIERDARRVACGGPVHQALLCPETRMAAVLVEADTRPGALELYDEDGQAVGRFTAPPGFEFTVLQQAPTLTPGFTVVCISTDGEEDEDWQFRIDLETGRLERYSPWR